MMSTPANPFPRAEQAAVATQMHQWIARLFPYHRSINGQGVRQTLTELQSLMPLEVSEIPTGTAVFDWTVPQEWTIRDAFIADQTGTRIVDYNQTNLSVLSGSQPIRQTMTFNELAGHLHHLPAEFNADWIPYRTAFFRDAWGFCISQNQLQRLRENSAERFEVVIDSDYADGSLTLGDAVFRGQSDETIVVYAHACHPSLANDNLSGMIVAAFLGQWLQQRVDAGETLRKTVRIVLAPATIGAISWLSENRSTLPHVCGGLILSLLGDRGSFTYKESRQGNSLADRATRLALRQSGQSHEIRKFTPFGYDERQFCSPGLNLPVGCLMRTPNGEFPEYHTSADDLDFVHGDSLARSLQLVSEIVWSMEQNESFLNRQPFCEPQLGDRGLYRAFGQHDDRGRFQEAVMWTLNLSDGHHDLIEIADRAGLPFDLVRQAADALIEHELLEPFESEEPFPPEKSP